MGARWSHKSKMRAHHLFEPLSETQLASLLEQCQLISLAKDEYVFHQGDRCKEFGLVISGSIKVCRVTQGGQEKVFEVIQARQSFAEAMMFMGVEHYVVTAQAAEPTELLMVPNVDYLRFLHNNPELSLALLKALSNRDYERKQDIEILSLKNATSRIINYLLTQKRCSCVRCKTPSIKLPITHGLIANKLSMRPETFSRIVHRLEHEGIVCLHGRFICLLDQARFECYE